MPSLLICVRFHEGRYHGAGDWPPTPARLFQALVAGAARAGILADEDAAALRWLEELDAPVIAAPAVRAGQGFRNYVPNNDLDAVGGDLRRIGEIRTPKVIRPLLFDAEQSLLYIWSLGPGEAPDDRVQTTARIAERLYQLGRGVDMAWAWAEIAAAEEIEARLAGHGGAVYRPSKSGTGTAMRCPQRGSLRSLEHAFRANQKRFSSAATTNAQLFSQAPKARFRVVSYNSPPARLLFDLRTTNGQGSEPEFAPWPAPRIVDLVTIARDGAAARLKNGLRGKESRIDRALIGRDAKQADKAAQVRIMPLPSTGHAHADHAIRRVLVEVPPNCPIPPGDIEWGFSGLDLGVDPQTGEVVNEAQPVLVPAADYGMLDHYGVDYRDGVDHGARVWRTVTPAALPQMAAQRRRDPATPKGGSERRAEEDVAAGAVIQALRHAGIGTRTTAIRIQREPFTRHGARAEIFAPGTRFTKERLWHVEIAFAQPVSGPLIIGDGRYLGLGLMEQVRNRWDDVMVFELAAEPGVAISDRSAFLRAVRRSLMALSRRLDGDVPRLFSGHETDGRPARSGRHEHVFLAGADFDGDGRVDRLIVAAPWRCDHSVRPGPGAQALFDRVVSSLEVVRAGKLGVFSLKRDAPISENRRLIGPTRTWETHTCYRPTGPACLSEGAGDELCRDVDAECSRRGFPTPEIELLGHTTDPDGGAGARLRLHFASGVTGPLLLGRDSHQGGGLFLAAINHVM
jgi:CRISPR-associated protein Csb2